MDVELLGIGHSAQTVAIATVFFLGFFLFTKVNFNAQLRKLPAIGAGKGETYRKRFLEQGKAMYEDGYKKVSVTKFLRYRLFPDKRLVQRQRFQDHCLRRRASHYWASFPTRAAKAPGLGAEFSQGC